MLCEPLNTTLTNSADAANYNGQLTFGVVQTEFKFCIKHNCIQFTQYSRNAMTSKNKNIMYNIMFIFDNYKL